MHPILGSWFQVQLNEVMLGLGNTKLQVPNHNDDPPQLVLKDVVDSSLVWEGWFLQNKI
jgi:hypothetical protein